MSLFKALVMVSVLLALGAYVYFVELPYEKEELAKKKLFTFDTADVTEVQLTYPDRRLHLKKDEAGQWRIIEPLNTEADQATVTNLINAIADAEIVRILDDPIQDPALYGLEAPVVKLQMTLQGGHVLPQVSIGKDTPVGYSVYLQREREAKLLLAPQAFRLGMTKEVKDVRDKTVIALNPDNVQKIEIQGQDKAIVLAKTDSGWSLQEPLSGKADDSQVQTFLSAIQNMKAQDFIETPGLDPKESGLAPPQLRVALTLAEDSAQKTLLIGNEKTQEKGVKQRYLKRAEQETLFLVGDWVFRDLNKSADEFRNKTIAKFTQDQATKVEVKRQDGRNFALTKGSDKTWIINQTGEGEFKEATATQLVSTLADLRGFEIAAENPTDLGAYGLSTPMLSMVVYDENNKQLASVFVTQKSQGEAKKIFAIAEGDKTVFVLRDYLFDRLNKAPADFWEKSADPEAAATPSAGTADYEHKVPEEDL